MAIAASAMLLLAFGYLVAAVLCGRFRNAQDPAEPKPDGVLGEGDQAPGGTGSGIPGRL
ncbi:hypothetical protein LWP59_39865 [Amycolatopsis acidiphila]|uniref:hypothetical protein n=1 Tax=Amycolatopsis acidiphila TaxID=715473 RepID=UPI00164396F5|nr:hypothetical protein [Amycolatopsis acidiphila]UIJ60061.1 hypothetical protein LWP59_39865 [Amycolatopsis acidiphila]GHG61578.1 hypothetical protein GCM10017788_16430 [Amycolatopsis acidiphila]